MSDRQILLIDGHHGVYVPQIFAEILRNGWGIPQEVLDTLKAGPYSPGYWDAWVEVLDNAWYEAEGHTWTLYQSPEGDLFSVRDDWEGPDHFMGEDP